MEGTIVLTNMGVTALAAWRPAAHGKVLFHINTGPHENDARTGAACDAFFARVAQHSDEIRMFELSTYDVIRAAQAARVSLAQSACAALARATQLRRLKFTSVDLRARENVAALAALVRALPCLETLHLRWCHVAQHCAALFGAPTALAVLEFHDATFLEHGVEALCDALRNYARDRTVARLRCMLGLEVAHTFDRYICGGAPMLRRLVFDKCDLRWRDYECLERLAPLHVDSCFTVAGLPHRSETPFEPKTTGAAETAQFQINIVN